MSNNPMLRRFSRHYRCLAHPNQRRGALVTWSGGRGLALAPKAPKCFICAAPMVRVGSSYQGLLDPSWDPNPGVTRRMFAALFSKRA